MIKFKELKEASGAGDWGTDKARKRLEKDTPGQGITQIGEKNKCRKESVELDEGAVALSTVEKEIRSNGGKIVKKDDRSITFTMNGAQKKVPVDKGHVLDTYYMQLQKMFEEAELDEGTDFRSGDTVYQVGSKLRGKVLHKGNRDQIFVKFGSITKSIPASELRLAESVELDEAGYKVPKNYASMMAKKRRKAGTSEFGTHPDKKKEVKKEEVELDEGTLAASDGSVVDALLTAVKEKLMKDLSSGNVDDANEIAKMVKMTIEKDYKRKGFSRLKR